MGRPSKSAGAAEDINSKKGRLTIAQLAAYDDVLTDVLVDHVSALHVVHTFPLTSLTRFSLGTMSARIWTNGKSVITSTLEASAGRM